MENIITPVKVEQLEKLLKETNYDKAKSKYLLDGFRDGFDLGYRGKSEVQLTAPNLKFTIGNKTELWNKVMKEVQAKRYAGPFQEIPFKNYIQSPIGLVPKDGGKKTRLIFHLSFPRGKGTSVNENTPPEMTKVKYKDFDNAIRICLQEGSEEHVIYLAKSDLSNAFRNLPINKNYWCYLIMKAENPDDQKTYFFVDKCLPFGASISCAVFQAFSDALAHIVQVKTGKENVNYLDDFLFLAMLQFLCNLQIDKFLQVCHEISFPVSVDKTVYACTSITFLGLLIDTQKRLVCIPVEKIQRALKLIDNMMSKKKTTLRELQQLCGFLNFLNKCIVPGRAFTRRLYAHGNGIRKPHHHINISKEIRSDLVTWRNFLGSPEVYSRPFFHYQEIAYKAQFWYTDASANAELGAGGVCFNRWFILQWNEHFIKTYRPSINYLELYAATIGILNWLPDFKNKNITIYCDNQSVINMINNTTSSCKNCMVLIRMVVLYCLKFNVRINMSYIKSKSNTAADLLSRMKYKQFWQHARRSNLELRSKPDDIPEALWPMEKIWQS